MTEPRRVSVPVPLLPHANAASHARVMTSLKSMTKDQLAKTLVDAGIVTPDGQLAEPYREPT